jgi:outer membrane protein assembly factor BamB
MRRKIVIFIFWVFLPFFAPAQDGAVSRDAGPVKAEPIWRQALGGAVTGLPAVQAQSAVVVLDGGNIKAYSTQGRPLWNYFAQGKLSPFVSRSPEGTCYISRTNGTFIAVNRAGRELWRLNSGGPLSAPAISGWDGRIFVPMEKTIACYTASGYSLWRKELEHLVVLGPILDKNGGLLMVLENKELLRIDPFGGVLSRSLDEIPAAALSLLKPDEKVDVKAWTRTLLFYKNSRVEIIDPASPGGKPHILPRLPAPPLAAVSRENAAAALLNDGRVILVSGDDGSFIWTGESHLSGGEAQNAEAAMIFDERGVYVLSKSGGAGFTPDGRRLWFIRLDRAAAIPSFGDDGILYSGGADWILYAYRLEDRSRSPNQSVYGPLPGGSYRTGNPPPSPWADYYFRFDEIELQTQLDLINTAIKTGRVGEEELSYTAYLMEIASAGTDLADKTKAHPRVQVSYRTQALTLLGFLGSRETIPFLANLFMKDDEILIKVSAAQAIGAIGLDPGGLALRAFTMAMYSPALIRDDQLLIAVANAVGALCRFSGPPLSDMGVKLLTSLTGSHVNAPVRARARRELQTLSPSYNGAK